MSSAGCPLIIGRMEGDDPKVKQMTFGFVYFSSFTGSAGLQKGVQEHVEHAKRSTGHGLLLWFDEVANEKLS